MYTSPQRKLMESDESIRAAEREQAVNPNDPQSHLRVAIEYLRNHPDVARQAGLNVINLEEARVLKNAIQYFDEIIQFFSGHIDSDRTWDDFAMRFTENPDEDGDDEDFSGGWATYIRMSNQIKDILERID